MNIEEICIPRIECSIKKKNILEVFSKMKIGIIHGIKEIPLYNDNTHKRILLQIIWNNSDLSKHIKTELEKNNYINIVYSFPHFWKINYKK
jgi:hypothetical protein